MKIAGPRIYALHRCDHAIRFPALKHEAPHPGDEQKRTQLVRIEKVRGVTHSMRPWKPPFWIGSRLFTDEDIALIETIVHRFSQLTRYELAATVCENLPWKAPNGSLKVDMCRQLLGIMASAGVIMLPPKRARTQKPHEPKAQPLPSVPIECPLKDLRPVTVDPVPMDEQPLWNATLDAHHPLGYRTPFGAHQRYWIKGRENQILGSLLFAAPAKALADRDNWIGWNPLDRRQFICRIVSNSRYLILPGVNVPNLASHALALATRRLRSDWQKRYGYAPVLLETFVTQPYRGTCYRAAGWRFLGETGSTNKRDQKKRGHIPIKMIFAYPLIKHWRGELLAPMPALPDDEEQEADFCPQF